MIADLSALAYLESRQIVNRIREALRRPSRMVLYLLAVGYFVVATVLRSRAHHALPVFAIPEPYASGLFFAYITLLGIMMYGAASGIVGAFSSASDARFLTGSLISQRLVVMWLQLRRSGSAIARLFFTLLLYALVFSRSGTFAGIGLAMIGGTIIATATAIPMLKLRRITGIRTAQSLAGAVAAVGILPMSVLFASLPADSTDRLWAHRLEHIGAGFAFTALFDGHFAAIAALYCAAALAIVLAYFCGAGLYPDLYASSLRVLEFRDRRRGAAVLSIEHSYRQHAASGAHPIFDVFRGPWTIVWKEWIAFVRSPSMQRMFYFGLLACAAVGALFGRVIAGSADKLGETAAFAAMAGNMIVIFVAMGSAVALSSDISKPLWWMGRDPLWLRLFAWIAGTSWRLAACLGIGIGSWALALHAGAVAAAGIPIAIALVLYLRAVGLALYALFPSTIDQRGPLAFVRALITYLFAAPPLIAAVMTLVVLRTMGGSIAAGIFCSLVETLLLVAFAAARIAGQGTGFARAEAM